MRDPTEGIRHALPKEPNYIALRSNRWRDMLLKDRVKEVRKKHSLLYFTTIYDTIYNDYDSQGYNAVIM